VKTGERPGGPRPGRDCPAAYGYSPRVFARAAQIDAEVLYVAGGLYGNLQALAEIERLGEEERDRPALLFNGDFHWFDAEPGWYAAVETAVSRHHALRGNVETELAADDDHGCGCAYPESVPDADVERSNVILATLREAARAAERQLPGLRARLAALPMHCVAAVGDARIGVVHGDAWSLAGWRFANDALHSSDATLLTGAFELGAVDIFASSHTCLPALRLIDTPAGERAVVNNGAAGMPNFSGDRSGLITRIATHPVPSALARRRRYGVELAGVYVDALQVRYDTAAWDRQFGAVWPADSAAAVSYGRRIVDGPRFSVDDALGRSHLAPCSAAA
jgi:hypothetical protein